MIKRVSVLVKRDEMKKYVLWVRGVKWLKVFVYVFWVRGMKGLKIFVLAKTNEIIKSVCSSQDVEMI